MRSRITTKRTREVPLIAFPGAEFFSAEALLMSPFSASASSTASVDSSWPQLIFRLKSAMAAETTQSASRSGSVGGALEGHCERLRAPVYLGRALLHLQIKVYIFIHILFRSNRFVASILFGHFAYRIFIKFSKFKISWR